MLDGDLHMLDVVLKHDETLFGSNRTNTIGIVEQITNINNQINMINNAPAPDVYTRTEAIELFDNKADKTDLDEYYSKSETYAKVEVYNKTEADEFLDEKANVGTSYSKSEDDSLLLLKADKTQLIDSYSKSEDDALLLLKADKTELIDSYSKSEDDALLLLKADKTDFDEYYTAGQVDEMLDEKADKTQLIDSYSKSEDDALLLLKADKTQLIDSYSKSEDDALLNNKADIGVSYTKGEDDALLLLKADKTQLIDSYTKTETDTKLALKADQSTTYTKSEDDALLLAKADKTDLENFVDLSSAQTITGQKQFGIVSVSSISKLTKNDASILLAGGGDMLVSSLVTQPQLQEVRDIASGRSKGHVFDTLQDLNDWMAIPDNVATLVIGDNLYIIDSQVTDYWWDGTQLRELETQLPDLTNVVTTLGEATGSGNAITDLQIDGNILTPAKNKNFIDLEYNQTITGQKTFTTTIHSVGITYLDYDNSNVILAGGGVRAIADIQGASYTKAQDDALLLLKADKTQLIDSYSKTETDTKLGLKADQSTTYTKSEDDALLLLKADKTQLIDSYSKTETDNLLNDKANQSTTYTKSEDDALLLLKADKTQIIDSYTKSQDDALLLLKADKTQLIDSYTKTETNNLLNNKANQSTTYTKTETDNLIAQIDVADVDLSSYYTKTKTDELLGENAYTTDLENYVTLGTQQVITANKTFQNPCRFTSSIDGTGTITGSSFVKSGADDSVVLLGAGGTKPISEFGGSVDDSNYVKKTGQELQLIHGVLRRDDDEVSMLEYDEDYLTRLEVDRKLTNYVNKTTTQTIAGSKTFSSNVTASGFAKTSKDDTSVLLAGGGDMLISAFGGAEDITSTVSSYGANMVFTNTTFIKIGKLRLFRGTVHPYNNISASSSDSVVSLSFLNHPASDTPLIVARDTTNSIKMYVSASNSTIYVNTTTSSWANTLEITIYGWWIAPQVYIDEKLLEAAGLTNFPELYAYIKEQEPKSSEEQPQLVPIGEQTLQEQVKQNAAIINDENNEFIPPLVENVQPKVDLQDQLELAEGCTWLVNQQMQQLSVSKKKVTYNFSLKTTKYFHGYIFENWPEQAKPRIEDKIIIIVGSDSLQKNNIFGYIDQNGPYISLDGDEDIQSGITIILSGTYYTEYTPIKQALHDSNNDNKLDIQDTWNEIAKGGEYKTQSWVYEIVKHQSDVLEQKSLGPESAKYNWLSSNLLIDPVSIYGPDRAMFYLIDGPQITFNFKSNVSDNSLNYYKVFQKINPRLLTQKTKYFTVHPCQYEFYAHMDVKPNGDADIFNKNKMEVKFNGQPGNRDVEFAGTYINDTYVNPESTDPQADNKAKSKIDEVIVQHDSKIGRAPLFTDYTITDLMDQVQFADYFRNGQIEIINEAQSYFDKRSSSYAKIDSGDKGLYIHLSDPVQDTKRASKVGKGLQWVNEKVVKPVVLPAMKQFSGIIPGGGLIRKGIETGSSALDAFYGQGSQQDFKEKYNDLLDDPYLRNLPIDQLTKAIQVQGLNTIESQLESNAVTPFKNDGEHHYSIKEIKPESQMPALFDKEIIISLSDSDHDVTQIQNSFLSIVLTANLQFDNKFDQFDDAYKDGVVLFVGLKSGSNIIREYTVYHRGRTIDGSLQNDATN
ncbi:MAG: hypothetical protein EZS28_000180 [Streblomastix strix]|uniref:Uncharacterized protein n=1 Tax=Streblomastix strix TaxID=222440 RepID=A0A5J4XAW6_9EUKA|nr:MAG: hypothetical protein EZS28_000180 [Streblomastix strix]